jgi:hypothetical protein
MLDNQQERRGVGRPSKPNRKQRINVTMSPETLQDIEEHIPEKQRSLHIELTLQAVHDSIFSLLTKINSDVVIRSIEPVGLDTLTEEEWKQIRGTGALVGNAPVYGAWLVSWTPERFIHVPYPWKVMVVLSIAPNTGTPAFMTVPARGEIPTYFER